MSTFIYKKKPKKPKKQPTNHVFFVKCTCWKLHKWLILNEMVQK